MVLQLLPSEIARLILNYLEDEELSETRNTFLNECKYLAEYKAYVKRGIKLLRTINGKTLCDYMVNTPKSSSGENEVLNTSVSTRSMGVQTDCVSTCSVGVDCSDLTLPTYTDQHSFTPDKEQQMDEEEEKEDDDNMTTKKKRRERRDSFHEEFSSAKKQKILIGREVEKVPDFSISSVNRQIDSLLADSLRDIGDHQTVDNDTTINHQPVASSSSSLSNMMFMPPPSSTIQQPLVFDVLKPHSMLPTMIAASPAVATSTATAAAPFFILHQSTGCSPLPSMSSLMHATPSSLTEIRPGSAPTPVSTVRIAPKPPPPPPQPMITEIKGHKETSAATALVDLARKRPLAPLSPLANKQPPPSSILTKTLTSIQPMVINPTKTVKSKEAKVSRKPSILKPPVAKKNTEPVIVIDSSPPPQQQPAPAPYSPIKEDFIFKDLTRADNKKMIELLNKHNQAQASPPVVVKKKKYNRITPTIRAIIDTTETNGVAVRGGDGYQAVEILNFPEDSNQSTTTTRDVFDEIGQSFDMACVKSVQNQAGTGGRSRNQENISADNYFKDDEASNNTLDLSLEDICVKSVQQELRIPTTTTTSAKNNTVKKTSSDDDDDDFECFSQIETNKPPPKKTIRMLRSRVKK